MNANIKEVFESFNGEVNGFHQGRKSVFVRFAGCNLRCSYCDTVEAQSKESGEEYSVQEVVDLILGYDSKCVVFTGGEPLLYKSFVFEVMRILRGKSSGYNFVVETNGTIFLDAVECNWEDVSIVVDYKFCIPPEEIKFHFRFLRQWDVVKYVISSREDFLVFEHVYNLMPDWVLQAVSANVPTVFHVELIEWLKKSKVGDVILNVQLHKLLTFK